MLLKYELNFKDLGETLSKKNILIVRKTKIFFGFRQDFIYYKKYLYCEKLFSANIKK